MRFSLVVDDTDKNTSLFSFARSSLQIEPQGALKVKKLFEEAVLMFIAPSSMKVLKQRLEDRGRETAEQIEERLEAAKWELSQSTKYYCIFVND